MSNADRPAPPFSTELTDAERERLAILLEECGEVQQAVGKILRHGYYSYHPHEIDSGTNRESLERELGDLTHIIDFMAEAGDVSPGRIARRRKEKREKIKQYLHFQPEIVNG